MATEVPEFGSSLEDVVLHMSVWHAANAPTSLFKAVMKRADMHVHGEFAFPEGEHFHRRSQ